MTDKVAAVLAIRELQASYIDAIFRRDYPALGNCFTENCEWRIGGKILRGRDQVTGNQKRLETHFRREMLNLGTPILSVEDGTAFGRTYLTQQGILINGKPFTSIGTSFDRFINQGDQWRFSWSLFQTYYFGPPDFSGSFIENPDYGAHPAMPPLDAIPAATSPSSKLSGVTPENSR